MTYIQSTMEDNVSVIDLVLNKCLSRKCLFHVKQKGRKVQNKLSFFMNDAPLTGLIS